MSGPDELVDRAWEVHDADLAAGRRFRGMTRRLPSLMYQVGKLAWQASHLDCAVTVSCDLVSGLLSAFGLLATTRVLTTLLDSGPTPARVRAALPALLFVLAVTVVQMALNLTAGWTENRLLPEVTRITERRLFAATTRVDLAAFDAPGFYDSLQRARDRGISEAARGVELAVGILTGVARLAAALSVLLVLSPVLLPLLAVAAAPDAWAAVRIAKMRYLTSYELAVSRRRKWILADLMADRRAAAEVRSFNMHGFLLRTYDTLAGYERGVRLALARRQSLVTLAGDVAAGIGLGLVYLALGILLSAGWIALPVAGTAALAIRSAVSSLARLLVSVNQCYESGLYFSDYLDFCAEAERNIPGPGSLAAPRSFRTIAASHVTFAYPGSSRNALTDVSIDIHQGEVVALVGENGSGKTTLAKLLAGLYEPSRGVIRWDGEPLVDVDREGLRERIAVIMQDYTRWPMTALENITMGSDRDERLLAMATAAAGADRIIEALPEGGDTHLDRRFRGGTDLSGGQWQRVAIARGFYRNAALLICDEPTSALDARSEHALFDRVRAHAEGRTVLLITHRLASVRQADYIYVLDHGRVVEQGSHERLMANAGLYADLYTLQASAYDLGVTELPGPYLADQVQRPAQGCQSAGQPLAGRIQPDGGDPGVAPHPQPLAHHVLGPDQRGGQHHLVGDQPGRAVPVTGLPALPHRRGDLRPALPAVGAVVEVRAGRAHPAQAEGQLLLPRSHHRPQRPVVIRERHLGALADVKVGPRAARRRQPRVQVREVGLAGVLGHKARPQPPVRDLPGQPQHRGREGGQVDRDGVLGPDGEPHRPGLASRQRDRELPPGERNFLAPGRQPHDLDRLPHPRQRMAEWHAVQPLDHLRARGAQAQQEPAAGDVRQGDRRPGDGHRRPGAELDDPRSQQHAVGSRGQEPQRRRRLGSPCLGHPADVQTQLFRLADELDRLRPVPAGGLDRGRRPHHTARSTPAVRITPPSASPRPPRPCRPHHAPAARHACLRIRRPPPPRPAS